MATYQFQVRLQGETNLPDDVFENVLFFDVNAPDTVQGRCQDLVDLYQGDAMFGGVVSVECRAYPLAGGQPVAQAGPDTRSALSVGYPHEVAICLSYATVDDPESSTARRRGRIFLGPISSLYSAPQRPNAELRDHVLDFGESLAALGTASNTTWQMYSRTDGVAAKIESIWVDDAWDTQRRRGLAPTLRDTRDVQ